MAAGAGLLAGDPAISSPLLQFLVQIIIVVAACRLMSMLFAKIKQPSVIAEIVTGVLLGPSALGKVAAYNDIVFPESSISVFEVIADFGLIYFLFLVGMELDFEVIRKAPAVGIAISVVGMITPFALGIGVSVGLYKFMNNPSVSFGAFLLFTGVAMSITAFPVLARILAEKRLLTTKIGTVTMSAAATDDMTAWVLLALVTIIINSSSKIVALYIFLCALAFVIFMLAVFRPVLAIFVDRFCRTSARLDSAVNFVLVTTLVAGFYAETIGIHSIFGGFIVGLCVPRPNGSTASPTHRLLPKLQRAVEDFVMHLLLPLYFTYSGLRTNLGTMNSAEAWGWCILVIVLACTGKLVACMLMSRLIGLDWKSAFAVGAFMNTKGLVELIVLNVGLSAGVITTQIFTMFVVMALVTTFLTGPLVSLVNISADEEPAAAVIVDEKDKKEAKLPSNGDVEAPNKQFYRITAQITDAGMNANVMALCHFLHEVTDSVKVHAVRVLHLDHGPSSYMTCESALKSRDELLQSVATLGQALGIVVKRHVRLSSNSDPVIDLCDVAWRKGSDLLIVTASPTPSLLGRRISMTGSDNEVARQIQHCSRVPTAILLRHDSTINFSSEQVVLLPFLHPHLVPVGTNAYEGFKSAALDFTLRLAHHKSVYKVIFLHVLPHNFANDDPAGQLDTILSQFNIAYPQEKVAFMTTAAAHPFATDGTQEDAPEVAVRPDIAVAEVAKSQGVSLVVLSSAWLYGQTDNCVFPDGLISSPNASQLVVVLPPHFNETHGDHSIYSRLIQKA